MPAKRYGNRRAGLRRAGAGRELDEQTQKVTTGDELSPARELAVWLRSLRSFFDIADHPLADAERASIPDRSFKCETAVVRDVLVRCLHLLGTVARGAVAAGSDEEPQPREAAPAFAGVKS